MEAKVDVRKLQMLNDRIIQTLEALTQVRASVHGIGQINPYSPYGQTVMPPVHPQQLHQQAPWAQSALGHSPALSPYAQYAPYVSSPLAHAYGMPGLSHSGYPQLVPTPWQSFPQQSFPQQAFPQQSFPQQGYPYGQAQWSPFAAYGLSHSGIDEMERRIVEQRAGDIGRLMQTFPYGAYV